MNGFRPFRGVKWQVILLALLSLAGAISSLKAQETQLGVTINYLPAAAISGNPAGTFQINLYNLGSFVATDVVVTVDPDPNLVISSAFGSQGTVTTANNGAVWLLPTFSAGSMGFATLDLVYQPCNVQNPATIDYTTTASANNAPPVFGSQEIQLNPPELSIALQSGALQVTTPLQSAGSLLEASSLSGSWQTVATSNRVAGSNSYVYHLETSASQSFFLWSAGSSAPAPAQTMIYQEAISVNNGPLYLPSGVGMLETEVPNSPSNLLNLVAGLPGPLNTNNWVIQNLSISSTANSSYCPWIFFDLPTNFVPGASNVLNFTLTVTSNALSIPDLTDTNLKTIYPYPVNFCGGIVSNYVIPLKFITNGVVTNVIVFRWLTNTVPTPFTNLVVTNYIIPWPQTNTAPTYVFPIRIASAEPGFTNVEQGSNQCVPCALFNSLDYLNSYFGLGMASDISVDAMTGAVQCTSSGTPPNWPTLKAQYMASNNIPIVTLVTNNFTNAMDALDHTNDVEIEMTGHVACVVGISQFTDGHYNITIQHDVRQGQPGGTIKQIVSYDPSTGIITGLPWGPVQFQDFVIEHPPP